MDSEPVITRKDWQVFREYGRTMLSAQLFEQALLGTVHTGQLDSDEDLYLLLKSLFNLSAGQLKGRLAKQGDVPGALLEAVEAAVECRNKLAHWYLPEYRMARFTNPQAHQYVVAELKDARKMFEAVSAQLDELQHDRARKRGYDLDEVEFTPDELRKILSEDLSDEAQ